MMAMVIKFTNFMAIRKQSGRRKNSKDLPPLTLSSNFYLVECH